MGEAASPVCFELAKRLKRAPRQIAQEIANGLGSVDGIAKIEVAGGGYLNAYFDRGEFWARVQAEESGEKERRQRGDAESAEERRVNQGAGIAETNGKVIVEHT